LATDLGYCGKDRARTPLTGLELRPCWEEGARAGATTRGGSARGLEANDAAPDSGRRRAAVTSRGGGGPLDRPDPMRLRGFVPIDELTAAPTRGAVEAPPAESPEPVPPVALRDGPDWASQASLFGDADG
jgi:hypothetical protein